MFLLLFPQFLTASVTVPFVNHDSMHFYPMGIPELENTLDEIPRICALIHDPKNPTSVAARTVLYRTIPVFSDVLLFVELDAQRAKNLTDVLNITAPHLVFYINGSIFAHYPFPFSETFLLHLLEFQGTSFSHMSATSPPTLYQNLGASYLSLVYPSNEDSMPHWIHRQAGGFFGSIDLVPFENSETAKHGLKPGQFYLFRMDDVALVEVDPNFDDVARHVRPAFRRFLAAELGRGLVFGIAAPSYTDEIVAILEAISEKFTNYATGLISPALYEIANLSVGGTLGEVPSIAIFNAHTRSYLPLPQEIASLQGKKAKDVLPVIVELLEGGAELKFVPVSQKVPTDQNRPYVKLVGLTYGEFVNDANATVVVLFAADPGKKVRRYLEAFAMAASRVTAKNVKFGAINVTGNVAAYPPISSLPRIEIFPANDKARPRPFFGRLDSDAILRFVEKYAGGPVAENVTKESNRDRAFEVLNIWKQNRTLRALELSAAHERLDELQAVMHMKPL